MKSVQLNSINQFLKKVKSCIINCNDEAKHLMNNQSNVFNFEPENVLSDTNLIINLHPSRVNQFSRGHNSADYRLKNSWKVSFKRKNRSNGSVLNGLN